MVAKIGVGNAVSNSVTEIAKEKKVDGAAAFAARIGAVALAKIEEARDKNIPAEKVKDWVLRVNIEQVVTNCVKEIATQNSLPQLAEVAGIIGSLAKHKIEKLIQGIPPEARPFILGGMGIGGLAAAGLGVFAFPPAIVVIGVGGVAGTIVAAATGKFGE